MSWKAKAGLLLASVALLSLSLAPISQFYLAWVGLVPWMLVVRDVKSKRAAFLWSWLGGSAFFLANMWWLWNVTVPGMFALTVYLGLYFGFAALIFRIPLFAKPQAAVLVMPVVWVACEYVRGNWSMFGDQGLPWLYLGTTQTPFLTMCQVADIGGVYAVSFWVMMINALVYLVIVQRKNLKSVIHPVVVTVSTMFFIGLYGSFMMREAKPLRGGPTVLVVQPNYKQSNTGEKGAPDDVRVKFHVDTTNAALDECARRGVKVDLVAWSETMMPPINSEARQVLAPTDMGQKLEATYQQIASLAHQRNVAMIVGAVYFGRWQERGDKIVATDRRNSAQFFDATGVSRDEDRYDKIHLVPFGEFIPYASIPPIYKLLVALGPAYYEDYILTPGTMDELKVFEVDGARFVVPICFEDIVGPLVAEMVRAPGGAGTSGKRADFLVNLTNDGWFMANEMPQHLQAAIFRSIENRVPTARSVNTGVSGFIDSVGRVHDTVPASTEGWSVAKLELDSRLTIYTRIGDAFPIACLAGTVVILVFGFVRHRRTARTDEK